MTFRLSVNRPRTAPHRIGLQCGAAAHAASRFDDTCDAPAYFRATHGEGRFIVQWKSAGSLPPSDRCQPPEIADAMRATGRADHRVHR